MIDLPNPLASPSITEGDSRVSIRRMQTAAGQAVTLTVNLPHQEAITTLMGNLLSSVNAIVEQHIIERTWGTCHVTLTWGTVKQLMMRNDVVVQAHDDALWGAQEDEDGPHQVFIKAKDLAPGYHGQQEVFFTPNGLIMFRRETDT